MLDSPSVTMRAALLPFSLALAACSGMPPDTLPSLERGQVVAGVNLAFDLATPKSPDVAGWFGAGVGAGVDLAVGFDVPLGLMVGGPRTVGALGSPRPPGLALRKTWPNGVGVGVGSSTRIDFSAPDSLGPGTVSSAGPFVTVGPPPRAGDGGLGAGRVTALLGYGWRDRANEEGPRRGIVVQASGQVGGLVAHDDTVRVAVVARAQGGAFLFPRPAPLHGPALGLGVQSVQRPGL